MTKNKTSRAKTAFVGDRIRVSTKISVGDYQALKLICGRQGWTLEERLAEILLKDIQYNMNTKWFREYVAELQGTAMGHLVAIMNGLGGDEQFSTKHDGGGNDYEPV